MPMTSVHTEKGVVMRLIDADALKLYIDKEVEEDKVLDGWAFFFKVYLDNAPSIDIVHCEECRHREEYPCKVYHDDDWFCADGERSER